MHPIQTNKDQPEKASKIHLGDHVKESATNSTTKCRFRTKRGVSLSKQHSINFDRMYGPKDLQPNNP